MNPDLSRFPRPLHDEEFYQDEEDQRQMDAEDRQRDKQKDRELFPRNEKDNRP